MKERPIIFNDEMVRAILDGRKTQTRRLVPKWQLPTLTQDRSQFISVAIRDRRWGFGVFGLTENDCMQEYNRCFSSCCPYGWQGLGDRLWVREAFADEAGGTRKFLGDHLFYRSDTLQPLVERWTPSIHMPRWASRITLEITGVRVERLNDISEADAKAEGVDGEKEAAASGLAWYDKPRRAFRFLWESIYGLGSWDANPWVWVIEFRRVS